MITKLAQHQRKTKELWRNGFIKIKSFRYIASLTRWAKSPEPKAEREGRPRKVDLDKLAADVKDHPDSYQYERAARFGVTQKAIWNGLRALKITYKKSLTHPKADGDARRIFREKISKYERDNRPVVYLDESGFAADMPRTHGYTRRGERCPGTQDWQARGRTNVIGALLNGVLLTAGLNLANVDADIFNLWLKHQLLPKLPPASIVVMDNATFHKRADTSRMLNAAGHTLEYLPPYSPDLNPIEPKWAQAKAIRRRTGQKADEIFAKPF